MSNVQCPDRVVLKKGNEFDCTAEDVNGDTRTVTITMTDREGGFDANLQKLDG